MASCCQGASFLPFLPHCDFVPEPVLVSSSPHLGLKTKALSERPLPSALPDAAGFTALIAEPPVKIDLLEGARLPGFVESLGLQQFVSWPLTSSGPLLSLRCELPNSEENQTRRVAHLGFEYLCPQGLRFFLPPAKGSGLVLAARAAKRERRRIQKPPGRPQTDSSQAQRGLFDDGEVEAVPLCPYRLYMPCVQHQPRKETSTDRQRRRSDGDEPCVAQLSRLWIQTPPASSGGEIIEAAPRLLLVDPTGPKGPDGRLAEVVCMGGKVALPHDSLVQIVLPTAYMRPNEAPGRGFINLPSYWELAPSDAERCHLLPYTFWLSTTS